MAILTNSISTRAAGSSHFRRRASGSRCLTQPTPICSTQVKCRVLDVRIRGPEPRIYYIAFGNESVLAGLHSVLLDGSHDTLLLRMNHVPDYGLTSRPPEVPSCAVKHCIHSQTALRGILKNVTGGVQFFGENSRSLLFTYDGEVFVSDTSGRHVRGLDAKPSYLCESDWPSMSFDKKAITFASVDATGEFNRFEVWFLPFSGEGSD